MTFDIDANGIVNVNACDKSTGRKQRSPQRCPDACHEPFPDFPRVMLGSPLALLFGACWGSGGGTEPPRSITIRSSGGLSDAEVERMVREAPRERGGSVPVPGMSRPRRVLYCERVSCA